MLKKLTSGFLLKKTINQYVMEGECNLRGQTCHSCKLAPRDRKRKILNSPWATSWRASILENPKLAPGEYGEGIVMVI